MTIVKIKLRKVLVGIIVFVALVSVVQVVYAVLVSPLQMSIATDKSVYQMGESVEISLTLRDVVLLPADIMFYSHLFDFVVQDNHGTEIYRWSDNHLTQGGWERSLFLMPSQTKTETWEWHQSDDFGVSVSAGTYKITGSTRFFAYGRKEYRLEAETTITIT